MPDAAAVVAVARAIVGVVAEVVVGRTGVAETEPAAAAAVEQTAVVLESWRDRTAKVTESEVAEKEWPDARVASAHTQLGTTWSETVVVEVVGVDSVVSAFEPERSE